MTEPNDREKEILFEGYSGGELSRLPPEQFEALALNGQPIVFHVGSATILGAFKRTPDRLTIDLAHIDGGGEGVLLALSALATRYSRLHDVKEIEWIIHAVNCDKPNPDLQRVLLRRGFALCEVKGSGEAYCLLEVVEARGA